MNVAAEFSEWRGGGGRGSELRHAGARTVEGVDEWGKH